MLYDTGPPMSCMAKSFFDTLPIKPKLIPCDRYIAGVGGKILKPVAECFIQLQIGKMVFRDRVVVIENLRYKYILEQVLHRSYWFSTGYSTTGKHYITINRQVIAQSILQTLDYPIIKTKGKVTLPSMSVSIIEVKIPKIPNTTNLYKVNANTFQLPEEIILLDILHMVNHETPQHLNIHVLNAKNVPCSNDKNMPIAPMCSIGKCEEVQEISWSRLWCDTSKLLPQISQNTSLQLEQDTKGVTSSIPDVDIPEEAKMKLQELLNKKYLQIISQNATDIGRTNLIELDIPMEGPPTASKPYTVLLKYHEFIDHKIKQLEEVGIIS